MPLVNETQDGQALMRGRQEIQYNKPVQGGWAAGVLRVRVG